MDRREVLGACTSESTALAVTGPGTPTSAFDLWCIVELMGHVRMAGRVTEEERFGAKMGRIDIPVADGGFFTQYFTAASVYRITPTTEEVCRSVQQRNALPIQPYELAPGVVALKHDGDPLDDPDYDPRDLDDQAILDFHNS